MKIRPVVAVLFHMDGRTDLTKVIVAFQNFVNAPKTHLNYVTWHLNYYIFDYHLKFMRLVSLMLSLPHTISVSCASFNRRVKWQVT
jgi:hypothetical protein